MAPCQTWKFITSNFVAAPATIPRNNSWGIAFGGGNKTNGAQNELFVTVGQGIGTAELVDTFAKKVYKP